MAPDIRRFACLTVLVALVSQLCGGVVLAGAGATLVLPSGIPATKSGVNLTVDTWWVDGVGYRPVRVTINTLTPAVADRRFTVEVGMRNWMHSNPAVAVTADLELPAGASSVQTTLAVPQYENWQTFSIATFEDGIEEPLLCVKNSGIAGVANNWEEGPPSMLIVADTPTDISTLATMFPSLGFGVNYGQSAPPTNLTPAQVALAHNIPAASLPENWLNYTSVDIVCLSSEQIEKLIAARPQAWQGLQAWLRAGGNLWIYDAGQDWRKLPQIEWRLELPKRAFKGEKSDTDPIERGWHGQHLAQFGSMPLGFQSSYNWSQQPGVAPPMVGPLPTGINENDAFIPPQLPQPASPTAATAAKFLWRDVQLGRVIVMAAADPFPGQASDWTWVFNTVGHDRWMWAQRHGLSLKQDNHDFWNFLIAGVGLPPVTMFQILITFFVVAIGPVNYFLLRRWKRLHLLLFTVPAAALLVSAGLLGYALIADGLSIRARTRGFTQIEQNDNPSNLGNHEASWTRVSYYAGLAPSRGLTLSAHTAAFPIEPSPQAQYGRRTAGREMTWDGDQRLTRGWLNARTPTQYLLIGSHKSPAALKVTPASSSGPLAVQSYLCERPLLHLLVRDDEGREFYAANVQHAAKTSLQPVPEDAEQRAELLRSMRLAFIDSKPTFPPGMQPSGSSAIFGFRRNRYYYGNNGNVLIDGEHSLLESNIQEAQRSVADGSLLQKRSFVALLDQAPVSLGVDAQQEESFHVIVGNW